MAGSLNKVMLIGNVGKAPEMRFTASGMPTTQFSVATSRRRRTPDNEWVDETEWHNIVLWDKLAERANEYVQKGTKIYIEGRLQTRSWEAQDGQKRYRTEIIANDFQLLSPRNRDGQGPGAAGAVDDGDADAPGGYEPRTSYEPRGAKETSPDDLPF